MLKHAFYLWNNVRCPRRVKTHIEHLQTLANFADASPQTSQGAQVLHFALKWASGRPARRVKGYIENISN